MNDIKLLALDLDGTLTNSSKKISKLTRDTIKKAQDKGVYVVITTGRPFIGVKKIADKLDLWNLGGYIICNNGGQIIDCALKKNLLNKTIPNSYIYELLDKCRGFDVYPLSYNDNGLICEDDSNKYVKREAYNNGAKIIKVEDIKKLINKPLYKFMIVGEPTELNKLYDYLIKYFKDRLNIFFSEKYFLEITPLGIEKGSSLAKLTNMLGYTSYNVMACGDGLNDIPMLSYARISIAMDNAYDEVKKISNYITLSNDEDGVADAINKLILGGQ